MALWERMLFLLLVSTFMLEAGLGAAPGALRTVRAGAIVRGVVVMLVFGPLAAIGIAYLFAPSLQLVRALVLLSVAGVVPLAARGARAARGNLTFGVVLTLVLGVITPLTAAPSARALLRFTGEVAFRPHSFFVQLLLLQVAPLAIGVLVRSSSPRAPAVRRVVHVINVAALAAVGFAVLLPRVGVVLEVGWRGVGASVALAVVMVGIAHAAGGPTVEDRRALTGIANAPNVALALAIASGAGAPQSMTVMLLGVFLLRLVTGTVIQKIAAQHRRGDRVETFLRT